jgi:hypothetical protein
MHPAPRTSRRRAWLKPSLEAVVTLLLGGGSVILSLLWINPYSFKLGFDVEAVKTVAVVSECPGQYKTIMIAKVNDEEIGLFSPPSSDSTGDLTVEIRRDDPVGSPSTPLGCNKFSFQTSSYETDSEALVYALVSNSGGETARQDKVAKVAQVVGSPRRTYSFDVVLADSDTVAVVMKLHFRKMGVGQVYGRKVVNLVYDGIDSRMHPTLTIEFPFVFEITSTTPTNAILAVDKKGTTVTAATGSSLTVGAFFTDSHMIETREVVLFLAAALLGTGVALIAEFLRAIVRLAFSGTAE